MLAVPEPTPQTGARGWFRGDSSSSCLLCTLLIAQLVKNPPAMQETPVRSLGQEDPLEKGTATHSSILAWRIPRTTVHGITKESDMTERLTLYIKSPMESV